MTANARELITAWLRKRLDPAALSWLRERRLAAEQHGAARSFYMAFSAVPRRVTKRDLALTDDELRDAAGARTGWQPGLWTEDQAARTLLVLSLPSSNPDEYATALSALFDDADLGELVALYQALPLLAHPARHRERAAEGIRSNMKAVFEAVVLDNPYPGEQLDDGAWNQLVLKCLFLGSPLHRVHGVDQRTNAALAQMLSDYAHERWAAGRPVSPELWRGVGPLAQGSLIEDLRRVLVTGTRAERLAAALSSARNPAAEPLRREHPDVYAIVDARPPEWAELTEND